MCNASVLDRLNSLLEPNGFLSINEHCEPNGEPRIIKPHPDFRIFLTVDPRYGELSRAMRNRAVEIFITTAPPSVSPFFEKISRVESSIQGFSSFQNLSQVQTFEQAPNQLTQISIDHLAMEELALLQRFAADSKNSTIQQFLGFLQSPYGSASVDAISSVYRALPEGLSFLQHVQPIHPLSSFIATTTTVDQEHFRWLGARYEFAQDIHQLATDIESRGRRAQGLKLGA
uniref:ATPase dynein-related AAA domain-containing protein n=1 Tax=Bionectria ochroleuca TaxID=29856 RepID=A0A8H7TPR7_BIOOC